jgi:hypothetical protein
MGFASELLIFNFLDKMNLLNESDAKEFLPYYNINNAMNKTWEMSPMDKPVLFWVPLSQFPGGPVHTMCSNDLLKIVNHGKYNLLPDYSLNLVFMDLKIALNSQNFIELARAVKKGFVTSIECITKQKVITPMCGLESG